MIEALRENFKGKHYTSARLLTRDKWSWTYGRMEGAHQNSTRTGNLAGFLDVGDEHHFDLVAGLRRN